MCTNEAPVMRFRSLFVVVWFSAVLPNLVSGQVPDVTLERVVGKEPLEGKLVRCCLQDHLGYLWVGTDDGLNRYDGYRFTTFTHDPKVEGSISHSSVLSLYEDRQGTLWVGTRAGLNKFDRRTRAFTHFLPDPTSLATWGNTIAGLWEDSKGILWVAGGGIRTFDRITGEFTLIRHDSTNPESLPSYKCHAILEDDAGTLWIATSWGLDCYNPEMGTLRHFWVDEGALRGKEPDVYGYHFIQNIFKDHTGRLWLCTDAGPVAFDRSTGKFTTYAINRHFPDNSDVHSLSSMCEDDRGRLWIGVWGGGLMAYDAKADSFEALPFFKSMVPSTGVGSLYKDGAGTIWVGTSSDGLWKMVRPKRGFTPYTHDPKNPNGLSNPDIAFLYEAGPGVIAAVGGAGADCLDRRTGAFYEWVPFERPYSLTGWLRSRTGHVYTGGAEDGFNVIQEKPYRRREISTVDQGLGGSACSLFEDRRGIIWMLTSDAGVCQFDPGTEKFKKLGIGGTQPFVTSHMIMEDSLNERPDGWALWIGTQDGLWRFDARSETYTHFSQDPRDPASISSNSITTLLLDHNHTLWVGTDQGLSRMDSAGGRFTCFGEAEGLSEQRVLGILEDMHGRLWVSTRSMLSRFDPQTNRFNSYGLNQVIKNIHFVPGCCLRSSTGEMYFGGQGGFVLFNPDSIFDNPHIPPVVLTGFKKFDTSLSLDSATGGENTIKLSYKDVAFSFEYVALDFTSPEDNQYAYKLEGYDLNWTHVGNRQVARYMNVEPGDYTFRVKGSNNDGIWNEEGTSIALTIAPPVWKTTWFTVCLWATALFSLGGTIRYIERRKLKQRIAELERERAVEHERARISQDMHDEVAAGLTEIGILSELAKRNIRNPEEAETHMQRVSEASRETIESIGEIIWAINPKNDLLDDLVAYLRHYTARYLAATAIKLEFNIPETIPGFHLSAEARRNVFLVMKETLHNIVKHSEATAVFIKVSLTKQHLEILVKDNGKGFSTGDTFRFGNGLHNMEKRMKSIGGGFVIESRPGGGTCVSIAVAL
jgi:signal transduction histidine kinase/ligand-binding sensor domain-containing protein